MLGIPLLGMCDIQSLLLGNSKVVEQSFSDQWKPVVYFRLVYLLKSIFIRFSEPLLGKSDIPGLLLGTDWYYVNSNVTILTFVISLAGNCLFFL